MVSAALLKGVVVGLTALMTSYAGVAAMRRWADRFGFVDVPNDRSLHTGPRPRAGGVAFVATTLVGGVVLQELGWVAWPHTVQGIWLGGGIVAAVSLIDDRWGVPTGVRFGVHAVAALILVAAGGTLTSVDAGNGVVWRLGVLSVPLTLFWVIGMTNAYNFMDGIDGLAAGQAVVTALALGGLAWLRGDRNLALGMLLLGAAVSGFLWHNWPPATIFMGDVGSAFLGFIFAGWSVAASQPLLLAWVAVLSPFIVDTSVTLARRSLRGERLFEPHRQHYYQRLVSAGWTHLQVTGLYLVASASSGAVAIWCYRDTKASHPLLLLLGCLPLVLIHVLVSRSMNADRPVERSTS